MASSWEEAFRKQKEEEEANKISLAQIKKKFKLNDEMVDFIMKSAKENGMTSSKISQKTGKTVAVIAAFLKHQGIKIKRY